MQDYSIRKSQNVQKRRIVANTILPAYSHLCLRFDLFAIRVYARLLYNLSKPYRFV